MKEKIPISELKKEADEFCQENKVTHQKQVANFDVDVFGDIVNLYRKDMPIQDGEWKEYVEAAKKSKDLQMAIVRHPNVPANIIDMIVKECNTYIPVYEHLFFSDKKMFDNTAASIYAKPNVSKIGNKDASSMVFKENPYCANAVVNTVYLADTINNYHSMSLHQRMAFRAMNDSVLAERIVRCDDVDEEILRDICGNKNLSDSVRKEAYDKGIDYVCLDDTPKSIINDVYEKAIYIVFKNEFENNANKELLRDIELTHIQFLSFMIQNNLLNGGQIKNLLAMCGGYDKEYSEIYESVAETANQEDIIREIYTTAKTLPIETKNRIDGFLLKNDNLPDDICAEYAKELLSTLNSGDGKDIDFNKAFAFRDMTSHCKFDKETEDMLMNFDIQKVNKDLQTYASHILCGFIKNKDMFPKISEKFEHCDNPYIRLQARIAKEKNNDREFEEFFSKTSNLRRVFFCL